MPRELYLATPRPVTFEAVVQVAAEVNDQLTFLVLYDGRVMQLLDESDQAVVTLESSRLLADCCDAVRIVPGLDLPGGEVWWTEMFVPWGDVGRPGVDIGERLAVQLDGRIRVEDGR